jgi:hypothetical protein
VVAKLQPMWVLTTLKQAYLLMPCLNLIRITHLKHPWTPTLQIESIGANLMSFHAVAGEISYRQVCNHTDFEPLPLHDPPVPGEVDGGGCTPDFLPFPMVPPP